MTRQKANETMDGMYFKICERLVQQALIPWIVWVSYTILCLQVDVKDFKNHVCPKTKITLGE